MIFELIALVILCSAISIGFYASCQFDGDEDFDKASKLVKKNWPNPEQDSKMIFWWVRYYIGRHISYYYSKPLYSCIICMGSVHSVLPTIGWMWLYGIAPIYFIALWPFVALATAGVNYNISNWWHK